MKSTFKTTLSALAAGAMVLTSLNATANTITVDYVSGAGGTTWTYDILFANTELPASGSLPAAFFELTDVGGTIGSVALSAAVGTPGSPSTLIDATHWVFTTPTTGSGIGPAIATLDNGDSGTINNLLFTWNGANTEILTGSMRLTFTSTITTSVHESYSSGDRVLFIGINPLTGLPDDGANGAGGDLLTPGVPGIPDGGTTVLLLGAALSGLGLIRRKLVA